ncbi:hypothetical protein KY347_00220 [Candidatus Woesearchaeota archaeon]|nr:hypothetical protein [Candidatus Woesearchaeota archaeon]
MGAEKKEEIYEKNELLRKLILTRLKSVRKEKFGDKAIDKLSLVFRVFLLRHLNLNYEFTLEELIAELNKRRISSKLKKRVIAILNLLTELMYEDKKISQEEFKSMLTEAESIVSLATGQDGEEKKTEKKENKKTKESLLFNFVHRIGLVKVGEAGEGKLGKKEIKKREKTVADERGKRNLEEKKLERLALKCRRLTETGGKALAKNNLKKSCRIYSRLIDIYTKLPNERRAELFGEINSFYKSISEKKCRIMQEGKQKLRGNAGRKMREIKGESREKISKAGAGKGEAPRFEKMAECHGLIEKSRRLLESGKEDEAKRAYLNAKKIYLRQISRKKLSG